MRSELLVACDLVECDDEARVVVLRGDGDAFSTGADLREFGRMTSVVSARRSRELANPYRRLLYLRRPTIAVIDGPAAGGGLELALCCDIRIGTRSSSFGLPEVRRGFIPGGGGTQLPRRRCGRRDGGRLALDGRMIDAGEARRLALIHELVPTRQEADRRGVELAAQLATSPASSLAVIRECIRTLRATAAGDTPPPLRSQQCIPSTPARV
jgi:enoyl-CoA hydratase